MKSWSVISSRQRLPKRHRELGRQLAKKSPRQRSRARTSATMATQEQVQKALQHLQAEEARIAAGDAVADRTDQGADSRTRKDRVDSDSGSDAPTPWSIQKGSVNPSL